VIARFLCVALLALVAVQAAGLTTIGPCWSTCPDDDPSGACTDDKGCDCCVQARVVLDRAFTCVTELTAGALLAMPGPSARLTPDPRDILHVPLPSLS
jgi:hypothetical protein